MELEELPNYLRLGHALDCILTITHWLSSMESSSQVFNRTLNIIQSWRQSPKVGSSHIKSEQSSIPKYSRLLNNTGIGEHQFPPYTDKISLTFDSPQPND